MGRPPSPTDDAEKAMRKGPWSTQEDEKLREYIKRHGHGSWKTLPELAGLNRCGKSCRLRWMNYLRPEIKRGKFSPEEESLINHLHSQVGNRWSTIATHLPGRTDNEIKNFWNTQLKKKLLRSGIDPDTHMPLPRDPNNDHLLAQLISAPTNLEVVATEIAKLQLLNNLMETIRSSSPFPFLGFSAAPPVVELPQCPTGGNPGNNNGAYELSPSMVMNSWTTSEGGCHETIGYSGFLPGLSSGEVSEGACQRERGESSSEESSTISIFEDLDKLMEEDITFLRDIFD